MRNNLFCPFIKQECKKDECGMWNRDTCLITVYLLSNIVSSASRNVDNNSVQEAPNEKLDAIFSKSAGELADEIIQFAKDENLLDDDESYLPHEIEDLFWLDKGLELYKKELPQKNRSLKKKAWLIASKKLKRDSKTSRLSLPDGDSMNDEKTILPLSNELLAEQLLVFAKELKLGEDDSESLNIDTLGFFWKSKGIHNTFSVSADISIKIKQVEKLARDKVNARVFSALKDELSQELADYAKKKTGRENGQAVDVQGAAYTFWQNKGLDYRADSLEIRQRKHEIEQLAQEIIDNDFHEYKNKRIETEMKSLPKLIKECVVWAQNTGRSNVTIKDVKYFLFEKKIDILEETERALYLSSNNELKTRKKSI
jgi:hypothetical protein